jgi:hypothetical protein
VKNFTEVWTRIESRLEILLGDYKAKASFADLDKFLITNGVNQQELLAMPVAKKLDLASDFIRRKPTPFENTCAALDLLLGARFGFTCDQLRQMTGPEILEALDHAMGYDASHKPSIWEISK